MLKFTGVTIAIAASIIGFSLLPVYNGVEAYHSQDDMKYLFDMMQAHQVDTTNFFATSGLCENCHSTDNNGIAMLDAQGNDVSMYTKWQATMMANSAKDPFWRAKVSHETLVNPSHAEALETKCTSCHAPLGHYKAKLLGAEHYSIAEMVNDTFGLDGVSCGACHHIDDENLGEEFSGKITYDTNRVAYGPHLFPFEQSMLNFVGFLPRYSPHVLDAGMCASCHTLVTESVDLDGNATGQSFVEQATYHEWLNSRYNTEDVSCQACHMPVLEESVIIAANAPNLVGRKPYGVHELVGANTFMLELMKEHRDTLGINATAENYDSTIAATYKILQQQSITSDLEFLSTIDDTAYFKVSIQNLAGHKFPSGYPSRRAFVEFQVIDQENQTIFHSGRVDSDYAVMDQNDPFEPHYDEITAADQVQIYELVTGDVNGDFSTVLERAYSGLKDNRLVPQGFSKSHMVYDTTLIVGAANQDPNFNIKDGIEGSGSDELIYKIALNNYSGTVSVYSKVHYQSLPPHWMEEMFGESTPEIDLFRSMYDDRDPKPVLVGADSLMSVFVGTSSIATNNFVDIEFYPNPTSGIVNIKGSISEISELNVFDQLGRQVQVEMTGKKGFYINELPGIYFIQTVMKNGNMLSETIVVQ